jgi:hypothetical protein
MNTVPRVLAYLRRYPWMALGGWGCAIVSTLMLVVFPAVMRSMIDEVLTQHQAEWLTPLGAGGGDVGDPGGDAHTLTGRAFPSAHWGWP